MRARSFWWSATAFAVLLGPGGAEAQDSRGDLIQEARNEFDLAAKVALLARAADPTTIPQDSLWAVAVFDLAAVLIDEGERELAEAWIRWGARHGRWPIDRSWYAPAVVDAYGEVASGVTSEPTDGVATTTWEWPTDLDIQAEGTLQVHSSDASAPITVVIESEPSLATDSAASLPPGTYSLVASAEGYDTVRATREVLPGVTTVVAFGLPPRLPAGVIARVESSLVRVRFLRGGQEVCTSGVIVRPDGLVLTAYAPIQGVAALEVFRGLDAYGSVSVAATDPARNLAVLRFGGQSLPVPRVADEVADDQYVWSVHHPGCSPAASTRSRLAGWPTLPAGEAPLRVGLPDEALGSPVVDRTGALLGVAVGPDRVAPIAGAQDLLDAAVTDLLAEEEQVVELGGGGFPFAWVGAGAAIVGVAALLFGGGDDAPTTGGISVTFPGGSP